MGNSCLKVIILDSVGNILKNNFLLFWGCCNNLSKFPGKKGKNGLSLEVVTYIPAGKGICLQLRKTVRGNCFSYTSPENHQVEDLPLPLCSKEIR